MAKTKGTEASGPSKGFIKAAKKQYEKTGKVPSRKSMSKKG